MKKIIILFGSSKIIKKAKIENIYTINILLAWMINRDAYSRAAYLSDQTIILKDINELDRIMENIVANDSINAIVSFTDSHDGVWSATKYSNKLLKSGITTSVKSAEIVNDKILTRKYLDSIKLDNVKFIGTKSVEKVIQFFHTVGKTIIIKPINGQGSLAVKKTTKVEEIMDYFTENPGIEVIAEEFLQGKEVSVESIIINGKVTILGITEKFLIGENPYGHNPLVESGHLFPANISVKDDEAVRKYITKFLEGLEVTNSLCHSEVIITSRGPILIESHLRAGGDHVPRLVENATGHEMHQLFLKSLFEEVDIDVNYTKRSAIKYFITDTGEISKYKDLDRISIGKGLDKLALKISVGQKIMPIRESFDRVCGYIISVDKENPISIIDGIFNQIDAKTNKVNMGK